MPRLEVRTYFHTRFDRRPDGRSPTEATRVFGRNAQIAAIRRRRADEVKSTPEQAFGAVQKIRQTARKAGVSLCIAT